MDALAFRIRFSDDPPGHVYVELDSPTSALATRVLALREPRCLRTFARRPALAVDKCHRLHRPVTESGGVVRTFNENSVLVPREMPDVRLRVWASRQHYFHVYDRHDGQDLSAIDLCAVISHFEMGVRETMDRISGTQLYRVDDFMFVYNRTDKFCLFDKLTPIGAVQYGHEIVNAYESSWDSLEESDDCASP